MDEGIVGIRFKSCPDGAVRALMPDATAYALICDENSARLTKKYLFGSERVLLECRIPKTNAEYTSLLDMLGIYACEHMALLLCGILEPEDYNTIKM